MGVMSRPITNVMTAPMTDVMGPESDAPPYNNSYLYLISDNSSANLLISSTDSNRLLVA